MGKTKMDGIYEDCAMDHSNRLVDSQSCRTRLLLLSMAAGIVSYVVLYMDWGSETGRESPFEGVGCISVICKTRCC